MLELPKLGDEHSQYDGSRIFTWLANMCGLSVDLINFLLAQVLALFLASLFRSSLHPSKVSAEVRHAFGLLFGLFFGYFCFGQQAIHIAGLPALCFIVIRTQNPEIVQRLVMIVAMIYLSLIHLHRQYYDYGSYSLDITGPLMIITQKVTSLAFSIHDGFTREEYELTKSQKYHAVRKLPSALEYFSYVLHFQGLMAGPMVFYTDYIEFIEGYHILKHAPGSSVPKDSGHNEIVVEPSPVKAVVKKVIGSMVCALVFMKFITMYPIKTIKEEDFIDSTSFVYKFWYAMCATTVIRFKYYHAWLLADAICNNSGMGFNGWDQSGEPKWDMISNISVLKFEFSSNFRDCINNWNMGTNRWLRNVVYERVPKKYGTVLTFSLSALWHGFYPGYYVTFSTGALFVMSARIARKLFRHRFQSTSTTRILYDIATCAITRVFMGYATFPFVLLEFNASLRLYLKMFMCLHLVGFATIYVLPRIIRADKSSRSGSNVVHTTNTSSSTSSTSSSVASTEASTPIIDHHQLMNGGMAATVNTIPHPEKITLERLKVTANGGGITTDKLLSDAPSSPQTDCDNNKSNNCKRINGGGGVVYGMRMDQPSQTVSSSGEQDLEKIKSRIMLETRNIEEFFDKTVTGIVELKDDLMRMNEHNEMFISAEGLRKRSSAMQNDSSDSGFIMKEIDALNAVVQQANVLPAVLSNGHAK